jgi:hypothetical protein
MMFATQSKSPEQHEKKKDDPISSATTISNTEKKAKEQTSGIPKKSVTTHSKLNSIGHGKTKKAKQ